MARAPYLVPLVEIGFAEAWEVAITSKDPVAREAVLRIKRIFDLDRSWRGKPPDEIRSLRELHLRPHTDAFLAWVAVEYERVKDQRGMLRSALGFSRTPRKNMYASGTCPAHVK